MGLYARVSSVLERRIHVVTGNVRTQLHMTNKGRRRGVHMLQNGRVGSDSWTHLCRREEAIRHLVCVNAARAE